MEFATNFGDTTLGFPEAPDTLDEEDKIASLESVALDIEMVINNMQTAKGVSQKLIRPGMHLLPTDVKFNSFTQNPTHTNYEIAMESMKVGLSVLIGSAVAAAALLLIKIIAWLVALFKGNSKATAAAQKASEEMTKTIKTNDSIERLLTPELKRDFEAKKEARVSTTYAEMAKLWNPLLRDVIEGGPMSRTIGGADKTFLDIIKKMQLMMVVIEREGRKDNGNDHMAASKVMIILNGIEFREDDPAIRNLFIPILRASSDPVDFQQDMREINDHLANLLAQPMTAGFDGDKVVSIANNYSVKNCPMSGVEPTKNLEQLESEVKRLEKMTFNKNVGVDVDRTLRQTITSLRRMMDVVRMFYGTAGRIVRMRNQFIELAKRSVDQHHNALVSTIVSSTDSDAKNKLRDLNKKR